MKRYFAYPITYFTVGLRVTEGTDEGCREFHLLQFAIEDYITFAVYVDNCKKVGITI